MSPTNPLTFLKYYKCIVIGFLAITLGACATPNSESAFSRAGKPEIIDGIDVTYMANVIREGFEEIRDRSLEQPDIDGLFTAALHELKSIDIATNVLIDDEHITIAIGDGEPVRIGEVPHGDVNLWTARSIHAVLVARRHSDKFLHADYEDYFRALFDGALSTLDRFSRYSDRKAAARNRLMRNGVMGLGVRVEAIPVGALVQAIVSDGPASSAGVLINDLIVSADGVALKDMSEQEMVRLLDGDAEGAVTLNIRRPGEKGLVTLSVKRQLIVPDTVSARVSDGIVELKIRGFNQRTSQAVEDTFNSMRAELDEPVKGLILDLRGDPGGLLDQAISLADLFLDRGSISDLRGRHPAANQSYRASRGDISDGVPMVVIVDGRAASASEILAAALQDNGRAVVVGTVTLGKGSVQTIVRLPNNGEMALTWSRAATPRGVGLHGLGILPDICLSGQVAPAREVISELFVAPNPMVDYRARWLNPPEGRQGNDMVLRGECPAETRTERTLDLEIARRIVSDPVLLSIAVPENSDQLAVSP